MRHQRPAAAALVSLLVVAMVTLIMALAFSENSLSTLEIESNSKESARSFYLAESCLDEAITRLEADLTYMSGSLSFDSERSCTIQVSGTSPVLVEITTTVDDLTERYEAELSYTTSGTVNNFSLSSWEEVP